MSSCQPLKATSVKPYRSGSLLGHVNVCIDSWFIMYKLVLSSDIFPIFNISSQIHKEHFMASKLPQARCTLQIFNQLISLLSSPYNPNLLFPPYFLVNFLCSFFSKFPIGSNTTMVIIIGKTPDFLAY